MPVETTVPTLVDEIVERHRYEDYALVGILQDVQKELNWLPPEAVKHIAHRLNVSLSRIYAIATFYKAFSLKPRGKHLVTACQGTACHVRGAPRVVDKLKRELKVAPGETTPDMKFTLETVNCLGACALGPVVVCDGEYHGQMSVSKVDKLLKAVKD